MLENDEFKLPKLSSLAVVVMANTLLQITFYIITSSSHLYAKHLGGGPSFSGLVIGVPALCGAIALIPLMKVDQGGYKRPLHVCCFTAILGNIIYALAYKTDILYLILIGRTVAGFAFTLWMYARKYCSDPRLVGVRRRTTTSGLLVIGQVIGLGLGTFLGGILYKVVGFGESNEKTIFNGFTSPCWIMAGVWLAFWAIVVVFFEDAELTIPNPPMHPSAQFESHGAGSQTTRSTDNQSSEVSKESPSAQIAMPSSIDPDAELHRISFGECRLIFTMCWCSMASFFHLGAWTSNIPAFTTSTVSALNLTPFQSGNIIALGGATIVPFLALNIYFSSRFQDRSILAVGLSLGSVGLVVFLAVLSISPSRVNPPIILTSWALVVLGFNVVTTCTLSLLSKQLPAEWHRKLSLVVQYSNYLGTASGSIWGGSGVTVGMKWYVGLEIGLVGVGAILLSTVWKNAKAKTG